MTTMSTRPQKYKKIQPIKAKNTALTERKESVAVNVKLDNKQSKEESILTQKFEVAVYLHLTVHVP